MGRTQARIIAAAVLTAMAAGGIAMRTSGPPAVGLGLASVTVGDRPYIETDLDAGFQDVLRARETLFRTYDPDADEPVWVFLGYFDRQREGSQVHSPRHCYPGSGWTIVEERTVEAAWRAGTLPALVVDNGSEQRIVCFWYQTPFAIESDVLRLKLALTRQSFMRRPQEVVFASVSAPITNDVDRAARRAAEVARDVEHEIQRLYAVRTGKSS
ncbi:MAG TPA: EpsI family protein [Candidatus Krumholzibacteria bacterium]|nr:EpsI family protein [Candidatus Krumholzibacteria bacterium]